MAWRAARIISLYLAYISLHLAYISTSSLEGRSSLARRTACQARCARGGVRPARPPTLTLTLTLTPIPNPNPNPDSNPESYLNSNQVNNAGYFWEQASM